MRAGSYFVIVATVALVACNMPPKAPVADASPPAPAKGFDPGVLGLPPAQPALPALPPGPRDPAAAQRLVNAAVEHLETGIEELARNELQQAIAADPQNSRAQNLLRQITADPHATLGRDSFPHVVKPGESLSVLAGRYLNDVHAFYILARYNDIKVPRQVAVGQTVRIPGKSPPLEAARAAPPAPRAEARAPALAPAPAPAASVPAPEVALAKAKSDETRVQLVIHHTRRAREAFARQDLEGAIRGWDQVLVLEPGNPVALVEKKRAADLIDKVKQLPR